MREQRQGLEVKVGMHQGSVLSPFLLAVVVDVLCHSKWSGGINKIAIFANQGGLPLG